jgi:hypothetical protein
VESSSFSSSTFWNNEKNTTPAPFNHFTNRLLLELKKGRDVKSNKEFNEDDPGAGYATKHQARTARRSGTIRSA